MTYKPNSQVLDLIMPLCRKYKTTPQKFIEQFILNQLVSLEENEIALLLRELQQ